MKIKNLILLSLSYLILVLYLLSNYAPNVKPFKNKVRYQLVNNWPQLPDSISLGNPTGIALDTGQNLVVFHRASRQWPYITPMPSEPIAEPTILILDTHQGKLIGSMGGGMFVMPHGLTVDRQNNIWVTDVGLHQVFKFSYSGKLLLTVGKKGIAGNDAEHFNRPTDVAVAADGSFYVTDGYGNNRVVKFSPLGHYQQEWGVKVSSPGSLDVPHAVTLDKNGNVYVADRQNARIQLFTSKGVFLKELKNVDWGYIGSVAYDDKRSRLVAVDDRNILGIKHYGSDILVMDSTGIEIARIGRSSSQMGPIRWYHDVAVDEDGNFYVGDILNNKLQKFRALKGNIDLKIPVVSTYRDSQITSVVKPPPRIPTIPHKHNPVYANHWR